MSLRISEVYKSVQGEGPRVGCPTIFVRFAGCNLRCPGWPCDTQHAIDPKLYRHEWKQYEIQELVDLINEAEGDADEPVNICFTGGEPFLQDRSELYDLITFLRRYDYCVFEFFTNGTLDWPQWHHDLVYIVMDWKLKGTGEKFDHETQVLRLVQMNALRAGDAVKFVIKDREDYEEAKHVWQTYVEATSLLPHNRPSFYYGVVWGALENSELVDWVLKDGLPWKLNVQVHNYIWDRNKRGI